MRSRARLVLALFLGIALASLPASLLEAAEDPIVAHLSSEVSQTHVTNIIQTLEDFGTRYSYTPQCDEAADWLYAVLEGFGLEVSFEPFQWGGHPMRNVIARLPGTVTPEQVIVIGAHYDSTSTTPTTYAPGADDNASGVAAVLEAARLLSGFQFEKTVEFICFGGEEQGRRGSKHNAARAAFAQKDIRGVINLDMIGYWPPSSDMELDIGKNESSAWLADICEEAALTYATIPVHNWPDTGVCFDDHVSYWEQGYDGIVLMDCYEAHANPGGSGESTPHYHKTTDTIETLDLAQTTEAVRAAVAATAMAAVPVLTPVNLQVSKVPLPDDVRLSWIGGVPPYVLRASTVKDFSSGVIELTPPGGVAANEWIHAGALDDGVDWYYRIFDPED